VRVAQLVDRAIQLTLEASKAAAAPSLDAFERQLALPDFVDKVDALRADVRALASSFAMPGGDF